MIEQSAQFGLLPEDSKRSKSFVVSALLNGLVGGGLLILTSIQLSKQVVVPKYQKTDLVFQPSPYHPPAPHVPRTVPTPLPKMAVPSPTPAPAAPALLQPRVIHSPEPAAPVATPTPVHMDLQQTAKLSIPQVPASKVSMTPQPMVVGLGVQGLQTQPAKPAGVVAVTGFGNGLAANDGHSRGKVVNVSLGNATAAGTASPHGQIATIGLLQSSSVQPPLRPALTPSSVSTAIIITEKPLPRYTDDARSARIEGDVVLRVTFTAAGQVKILSVVHGLGHGLDEAAREVAGRIRFKPATLDEKPVDSTVNIRVSFQLS
jgi:TonB family protein